MTLATTILPLSDVPCDIVPETLTVSSDAKHVAFVVGDHGEQSVHRDGTFDGTYHAIMEGGPTFSRDGHRLGYAACEDQIWRVAVDDYRSQADYEGNLVGSPLFSPDGSRFAYAAAGGGLWWVVVEDSNAIMTYEQVVTGSFAFSRDSARFAFAACQDAESGWQEFVVVDGVTGPRHARIQRGPVFSPSGKLVTYVTSNRALILRTDQHTEEYPSPVAALPVFGGTTDRMAVITIIGQGRQVVVDGVEGKAWDLIAADSLVFSPDGSRVAYAVRCSVGTQVVVDDVEGPAYQSVRAITFSPDSQRVAYLAQRRGRWRVVVDHQEQPAWNHVGPPVLAPQDSRLAYFACGDSGHVVVVDGHESASYDAFISPSLVFSCDGQHLAFAATRNGRAVLAVDEVEVPVGGRARSWNSDCV